MTEDEIRSATQSKIDQIKNLCSKLQVRLGAGQRIDQNMMINSVVTFTDDENYPMVTREPQPGDQATVIPENKPNENPAQ